MNVCCSINIKNQPCDGEANITIENVGSGRELYVNNSQNPYQFRTLSSGDGINLAEVGGNEIVISNINPDPIIINQVGDSDPNSERILIEEAPNTYGIRGLLPGQNTDIVINNGNLEISSLPNLTNIGTGFSIINNGPNGVLKQLLSSSTLISIADSGTNEELLIDFTNPTSVGTGQSLVRQSNQNTFYSLVAGSGITITPSTDDIIIAASGGGGSGSLIDSGTYFTSSPQSMNSTYEAVEFNITTIPGKVATSYNSTTNVFTAPSNCIVYVSYNLIYSLQANPVTAAGAYMFAEIERNGSYSNLLYSATVIPLNYTFGTFHTQTSSAMLRLNIGDQIRLMSRVVNLTGTFVMDQSSISFLVFSSS